MSMAFCFQRLACCFFTWFCAGIRMSLAEETDPMLRSAYICDQLFYCVFTIKIIDGP